MVKTAENEHAYENYLAGKSDAELIESFHNRIHHDSRNADKWVWEYEGLDPHGYVFAILRDRGRLIGTQGMIPIWLSLSGKRTLTAKSENSILDPEYRGGMHFRDLYEFAMAHCAKKNIQLVWGFTTAVKVLRDKIHFTVHENCIFESIIVLDSKCVRARFNSLEWSAGKKAMMSVFATISSIYSSLFRSKRKREIKGYSLENKLRNPSDMQKLYSELSKNNPSFIHLNLDEKFIDWRIHKNPNLSYKTLYVYCDKILVAYCFLNINGKRNISYMTDFTFLEKQAGDFLLTKVFAEINNIQVGYLSFIGNIKNPLIARTFKHLKGYGFVKKKSPLAFIIRNISYPDEEMIFSIQNWYVNGLWTEGYEV